MLFPQKLLNIQNFHYLLKCYLEKLPAWILVILINNVCKVDFEIAHTHHSDRSPRYLTKISPDRRLKHWIKNKELVIQKADKGNNIIVLNRSDYISKLSKILEDTSKFRIVNIEEGKALNHLIHMEERIIRLLKSLEDQGEISEKGKNDLSIRCYTRSSVWACQSP